MPSGWRWMVFSDVGDLLVHLIFGRGRADDLDTVFLSVSVTPCTCSATNRGHGLHRNPDLEIARLDLCGLVVVS